MQSRRRLAHATVGPIAVEGDKRATPLESAPWLRMPLFLFLIAIIIAVVVRCVVSLRC